MYAFQVLIFIIVLKNFYISGAVNILRVIHLFYNVGCIKYLFKKLQFDNYIENGSKIDQTQSNFSLL